MKAIQFAPIRINKKQRLQKIPVSIPNNQVDNLKINRGGISLLRKVRGKLKPWRDKREDQEVSTEYLAETHLVKVRWGVEVGLGLNSTDDFQSKMRIVNKNFS
ncbi:MAG: hypothetical protein KDA84_30705 [Planctomycetaceae bacterium]|nr:hypothetical protein [Planctomycetaceae bacterium]